MNRSFYYSILTTLRYKNNLVWMIISATIILTASLLFIPALTRFFEFEKLNGYQLIVSVFSGFFSVLWFEAVKAFIRKKKQ